jgi:hypothetical protein
VKRKNAGRFAQFADALNVSALMEGGGMLSRSGGQEVCDAIIRKLHSLSRGAVLLADFSGVQQMGYLALREVFSALAALRTAELDDRYLLFRVDTQQQEIVESLAMIARDRGNVIPAINERGEWQTLGRLTQAEHETLDVVMEEAEVTSTQLTKRLHLLPSAASNRLRRLYDLRLVKREERVIAGSGGREFVYKPLISKP